MPNNNVNFIFQDNKGFIWIGTFNGLSRFDGYSFKNVFLEASIEGNTINHFKSYLKINDSLYWVSTHMEGVFELNTNRITLTGIKNSPAIATQMFRGRNGIIWLGSTASGFYNYNPQSKKFRQFLLFPLQKEFRYNWDNNTVSCIVQDSKNDSILWLGCRSGLKSFNTISEKITDYQLSHTDESHRSALNHIISLFMDGNQLWVGRYFGGLGKFDSNTKSWKNYFYNPKNFEQKVSNDNSILKIYNGKTNQIWLATSAGPYIFDCKTEQFSKYILLAENEIINKGVTSILEDKFGNKWFGHIDQSGVSMSSSKLNSMGKFILPKQRFSPDYYGSVFTDLIYSKRYNRYFLTVTNHDGLLEYSENFKLIRQNTIPNNWKNYEPFATKVAEDNNGLIWILDITHSLISFDPVSAKFTNYKSPFFKRCETIISDPSGVLFFLTDGGLFSFSNDQWKKVLYLSDETLLSNIKNGKLYFIEKRTIKLVDLATRRIKQIAELPRFSTNNNNYIQSIFCDSKNRLWIPLELGGVYLYDIDKDQLLLLSGKQGLNSNTARETIEDTNGRIFLLCNGGFYHYDEAQKRFIDFNNLMGHRSNDWYEHFISITQNNQLLLSKSDSFYMIDQSAVLQFLPAKPIITSVSGNGFEFYEFIKTITIPNFINNLKISFSNFDFASAKELIYEYTLDTKSNIWTQLEKGKNYVDLEGLAEGKHILKLRIAGKKDEVSLIFIIKVVWYKSKLFYGTIILLFFLAVIGGFWYWQRRKYTEELLQKKVAEYKLKALQSQLNPHFLFNCLNSISALIKIGEYQKSEDTLQAFSKLMRAILTVSGEQLITLKQELELDVLYLNIEKLRKDNAFDFEIISNLDDNSKVMVPPMLLQPFLENCVKHGFKSIKATHHGSIQIVINQINSKITIEIRDNGCGVDSEKQVNHTSRGIEIQRERLKQYKFTNNMNIDIKTGNIQPTGYSVLIEIC